MRLILVYLRVRHFQSEVQQRLKKIGSWQLVA